VPLVTLPLAGVWAPSALAWIAPALLPDALPPVERTLVLVIALVAVVLAALAALIHDDLPQVVGYGVALDGGIAVLAFAPPQAAAEPLRSWLLVAAVARTALVAGVVAIGGPAGIRRVIELRGWARRAPLLGVVLLAVGVALAAWPGSAGWEARADLLRGALPEPMAGLAGIAGGILGIASAAAVGRLLVVGIATPEPDAPRPSWDREGWHLRLRLATASALVLGGLAVAVSAGWVG
jgi:NADH:ubiquinone oxidoreductase subunit 2 (subunit N)